MKLTIKLRRNPLGGDDIPAEDLVSILNKVAFASVEEVNNNGRFVTIEIPDDDYEELRHQIGRFCIMTRHNPAHAFGPVI